MGKNKNKKEDLYFATKDLKYLYEIQIKIQLMNFLKQKKSKLLIELSQIYFMK